MLTPGSIRRHRTAWYARVAAPWFAATPVQVRFTLTASGASKASLSRPMVTKRGPARNASTVPSLALTTSSGPKLETIAGEPQRLLVLHLSFYSSFPAEPYR